MSSGPRTAEGAIICGAGAAPYGWYMGGPGGRKTSARLGAYWGTSVSGRWPLLGSLRTRRLAILMDRLSWRGGLFLERASAAFGDGDRRGRGEFPEDNSSSVGRSISSCAVIPLPLPGRGGGNGRGCSCDCSARLAFNWVHRLSFSSRSWFDNLTGLFFLSCFHFLAPEEELIFGG